MKTVDSLPSKMLVFCTVSGAQYLNRIWTAEFLIENGFGDLRCSETPDTFRLSLSAEQAKRLIDHPAKPAVREFHFFELQQQPTDPKNPTKYYTRARFDTTDLDEARLRAKDKMAEIAKDNAAMAWILPSELVAMGKFRLVRVFKRCQDVPIT